MLSNKSLVVAVFAAALIQLASADSCVQCNSRDDIRCAEAPLHVQPTACTTNATVFGCFSRIVDGHTVRGCLDTLATDECSVSPMCNSCYNVNDAQGCNNQQYPEIRLYCHQCTGDLNSTCSNEQVEVPRLCTIFQENNQCYIRRTNETITRGCTNSDNGGCATREHCFICDGHGCNLQVHSDPQIPLAPSSATVNIMSAVVLLSTVLLAQLAY